MSEPRVLGTVLKPNLDWMRERCGPDGWARVLGRLDPDDRRDVELVNGALKYPLALFDRVSRAFADEVFAGDMRRAGTAFREMGRYTGAEQLGGIYSVFLRVSSPEATLKRAPSLIDRLYEGVRGESEVLSAPGGPRGTMTVYGLGDLAYSGPRLAGWAEAALDKVGVRNIRVEERAWQSGRITADPLVFELYWD